MPFVRSLGNRLDNLDLMQHSTSVRRALRGLSLPPLAGLLVRPIVLCQDIICNELSEAATRYHTGNWENSSQWHLAWTPMYDGNRPEPLWHPREPD